MPSPMLSRIPSSERGACRCQGFGRRNKSGGAQGELQPSQSGAEPTAGKPIIRASAADTVMDASRIFAFHILRARNPVCGGGRTREQRHRLQRRQERMRRDERVWSDTILRGARSIRISRCPPCCPARHSCLKGRSSREDVVRFRGSRLPDRDLHDRRVS